MGRILPSITPGGYTERSTSFAAFGGVHAILSRLLLSTPKTISALHFGHTTKITSFYQYNRKRKNNQSNSSHKRLVCRQILQTRYSLHHTCNRVLRQAQPIEAP